MRANLRVPDLIRNLLAGGAAPGAPDGGSRSALHREPGGRSGFERDALASRCDYEGARAWAKREVVA